MHTLARTPRPQNQPNRMHTRDTRAVHYTVACTNTHPFMQGQDRTVMVVDGQVGAAQ